MPICPHCKARSPNVATLCESDGHFFIDEEAFAAAPEDPFLGKYLGDRFAVMRILGLGGMGQVYEALQFPVKRTVAIKVLAHGLQKRKRFLARFEREAQSIAKLNHPNIVKLYDFGVDADGTAYIAMEHIRGQLLSDVDHASLSQEFLVHITAQMLNALGAAHEQGIIHRDFKPENVMLTKVGSDPVFVKVFDFGLAYLMAGGAAITAAGETFGTPHYMSPEQASGETLTSASDIYSLGCILYELITGNPPFTGTRAMNLLMKHVNTPPPPLQPLPHLASLSFGFRAFVMRCLEKPPTARFPSAAAALDALAAIPEGNLVAISTPSLSKTIESLKAAAADPIVAPTTAPALKPVPRIAAAVTTRPNPTIDHSAHTPPRLANTAPSGRGHRLRTLPPFRLAIGIYEHSTAARIALIAISALIFATLLLWLAFG